MTQNTRRVEIYDTTLRDGTQAKKISLSVEDKLILASRLDAFGIDYIEGGWPGSNPKDHQFFEKAQSLSLKHATLTAFGSTARHPDRISSDENLKTLLHCGAPIICIFGKTWRLHSSDSLGLTDRENETLIFNSVKYLIDAGRQVFFDAEHFFDGVSDNPDFAITMLLAAEKAGAQRLILCDTNGGSLPNEVFDATQSVLQATKVPIGIHAHNDGELGVANSLAAVDAGASHIQGTINGIGERCGNANLCTIIPNLVLKKHISVGPNADKNLPHLTGLAHFFDEMTNQAPNPRAAYVGQFAFTHKGGIHVSSVLKDSRMYEHISPESVGNQRDVVVSDLSGKSNIAYMAKELGISIENETQFNKDFVNHIKALEHEGFQFDGAEASLKLMFMAELNEYSPYFSVTYAKVNDSFDEQGRNYSEAVVKIQVGDDTEHTAADGNGPVNALDEALRKALLRFFPGIGAITLVDYKVRVLGGHNGTTSKVRVMIESTDKTSIWSTVGVSPDIIEASLNALSDSMNYKLYMDELAGDHTQS